MKTMVYITRHGETEWNVEKRMQGRKNSNLTETGILQAKQLGKRMKDIPLEVIYSSPSGRAMHTAQLIKGDRDIPIVADEHLYEIDMGVWEGHTQVELQEKYPKEFDLFWNAPHQYETKSGESFYDARIRVLKGLEYILKKHEGESVLLVSHAITSLLMMGHFEQRLIENIWNGPFMHSASLSMVEVKAGESTIHLFADIAHFEEV
ncbi:MULTISPECIES: phosphoserine phosphatase 1 [unclassified Bacillus (in: firmicutes)]|uniref:phosphoserine phosphatase 1 n=1 Tax=unclassified Bacillus (in: firmicutes) TaxID=185979 RepID=UPI00232F6A13|nr:phosphoserine phosphatase 1 [Bacillus sp. BP-3]MDC2867697.1 phosphoserine phosphatase 1 [Bacillus sp. BP-3]